MRTHRLAAVVVIAGLVLSSALLLAPALARDEVAKQLGNVEKGEQLLDEGDRLADDGKYDQAVIKYKEVFEQLLPRMRRLPFKREVKATLSTRAQLKDMLVKLVDDEIPPEELRGDELALKALGLIPPEMDLKQTMLAMLTEEIAGFYEPRTEAMHLIIEAAEKDPKKPAPKPGLFDKLFGGKKAFSKDENKAVLAHEMTHALADQHYDLEALQKAVEDDGDRELALTALIEGEAMMTMLGATAEDWDTEYLSFVVGVKVVDSLDEAVEHINEHGSHHTDAILTQDLRAADQFARRVDSASVMVNASTRFADGGEYGLGAEIGISTDKLHARGPMGAADLTTYKWVVTGEGHVR